MNILNIFKAQPGLYVPAVAVILSVSAAWAAPVDPSRAAREVVAFRGGNPAMTRRAPAPAAEQKLVYTSSSALGDCFYVFNDPRGGYTIVSADDRLPAVIGFSESGSYDPDNIPVNMQWWLSEYNKEITYMLEQNPTRTSPRRLMRRAEDTRKEIAPMVTTKWDQTSPFNDQCPIDSRTGQRSVTGCVATAMAQVMNFHEWPIHPKGQKDGYVFNNTTLDWANMIDDYSQGYNSAQANAVALLMRQCGASVSMMYSSYASGAYSSDVPVALAQYFDYNPSMRLLFRDYFSQRTWNAMVYDELAKGRPIYYAGQSSEGGHAFVCDGYLSNDYFHFNWGWGGYEDGYFLLNVLNPGTGGTGSYAGGYNANQMILLDCYKNPGGEGNQQQELLSTGNFVYNQSTDSYVITGGDPNLIYNPLGYSETVTLGLKVTNVKSQEVKYAKSSSSTTIASFYGTSEIKIPLPSLSDGDYRISPAFFNKYGEWQDILVPYGLQSYVTLNVAGGKKTYSNLGPAAETISEMIAARPIYVGPIKEGQSLSFLLPVINVGEGDFYSKVNLGLYSVDDFGDVADMTVHASVPGGSSVLVEFNHPGGLSAGKYEVYCDDNKIGDDGFNSNLIFEPYEIEVLHADAPVINSPVEITRVAPSFYDSEDLLGLTVTAVNSSREDVVTFFTTRLYRASDMKEMTSVTPASPVNFEAEKTVTLNFTPQKYNLPAGDYYWRVFDAAGKPISHLCPLKVTGARLSSGGCGYVVTDEANAIVRLESLPSEIPAEIYIPGKVGSYTVADVLPGLFTFASGMERLSLPGSVTALSNGLFYKADDLKFLNFRSQTPPAMGERVFDPDKISGITVSAEGGYTSLFPALPEWSDFNYSSWTFDVAPDITISGLLGPASSGFYNPYFTDALEWVPFTASAASGLYIKVEYNIDGEKSYRIWPQGQIGLPALYGKQASVKLTTTTDSAADLVGSDDAPVAVYTITGLLVKERATRDDLNRLPAGLYIIAGKKVRIP